MARTGRLHTLFLLAVTADMLAGTVHAQMANRLGDPQMWRTSEYQAQWGLDFIGAADAYALGLDGSGVKVGVVDSGIDVNHSEFAGRIGGGYDYVGHSSNLVDYGGHGTMVASVVAANRDGVGMHGVAPAATIYSAIMLGHNDASNSVFDGQIGAAWDGLREQGVRIINNSWGNAGRTIVDEPAKFWIETQPNLVAAARRAVDGGALMIFGAGNDGGMDPAYPAGLPYYLPELASGWLAVAALAPGHMPEWSNRCGVAMAWCLSAPGGSDGWAPDDSGQWVWIDDRDDIMVAYPGGGYSRQWGTSLAAPHVAGAAALVAQRFPYMSMAQVRQVLLGTAKDVGDEGVDEIFGYGLLDVGAAVRGPGKFDWGDFSAAISQGSSTWSNDITGAGGLVKSGNGVLVLEGNSNYRGATQVNGGVLAIDGSIASDTVVNTEGMLAGNGTIIGTVDNRGMVAAGSPQDGGALTIEGDYIQRKNGSLFVQAWAPEGTSRLDITGTAQIEGGAVTVELAPGRYRGDQRHTIVSAATGVSGRYDALSERYAFLDLSLAYDPKHIYLDINRNATAFADVGATGNQRAVGAGIESLGLPAAGPAAVMTDVISDSNGTGLYDRVILMDAGAARNTFDSLSGEMHASVASSLIDDSRYARDAISNRLRAAFSVVQAASVAGAAPSTDGVPVTASSAAWAQAFGAWGHLSSSGGTARLNRSSSGFFVGADGKLGDTWRAGLMGGYGSSSLRVDERSSSASVDSYTLAAYAGTEQGAAALRLGAAHTWHKIDTKRAIPLFARTATSDYRARTAQLFGETSYRFDINGATIEPFAQLAYVRLHTDGFSEGGAAGLVARSGSQGNTFSTLGMRGEAVLGNTNTSQLIARATVGWQHAFGRVSPQTRFSFEGGNPFTIEGVPLARDALVLDVGLTLQTASNLSINVSYTGQIARRSVNQGIRGGLSWRF
ncbi:subtilase-type serine protease [Advenella incenata]|uniref:Subtilase-type serine protease n=2 Tax=Advenella incenata TaxID=267800 RepID=A0A4Q7VEQ6_9BURK|nr:subtilase-type serine protease [Advenella incenata]